MKDTKSYDIFFMKVLVFSMKEIINNYARPLFYHFHYKGHNDATYLIRLMQTEIGLYLDREYVVRFSVLDDLNKPIFIKPF